MNKTIPIEIVLQDPSDPIVPTPEDNPETPGESGTGTTDNTNASAPKTGDGTETSVGNNNSNFASSSAAGVTIASTAILILAIVAAIAVVVRRYYKRKTNNSGMTRQEKRAMAATSTIAVLALTVLLGQLVVAGVVNPLATNAATSEEAELDVDDKITIVATRTEDEEVVVATVKNTSTATSHQTFGYKVTASMEADATTANLYLDGDEDSEYYIAPVEDGTLSDNTWGYTLEEESEDYLSIPLATDPATIVKGYDNIEDESVDIYYTIQVDKDLPAGTYTGTIEYTLTDNNFPSTLTSMQQMTPEICESVYTPSGTETVVPTATLTDTRDQKTYEIAKLADGNCWMTQNLDLDLDDQTALTPATSNVSSNWTPERSTIATGNLSSSTWAQDYYNPYSYDPGDVFYYSSGSTSDDSSYPTLAACQAEHSDCSMKNHVGNYYNWSATVASNDTSESSTQYDNMTDSICPAGWRMPNGPQNSSDVFEDNEFNTLITSYDDIVGDQPTYCGGLCPFYNYAEGGFNKISTAPLWLARSGGVYGGSLQYTGSSGYYWSSTVSGSYNAFYLYFYSGSVYPANNSGRGDGYSVRCLAE